MTGRMAFRIGATLAMAIFAVLGLRTIAASAVAQGAPAKPVVVRAVPVARPAPMAKPAPAASPAPYVIRRILPIAGPMHHGEHHWNESGAPAGGAIVVTVDLAAQVLSVFRDGYEIGAAVILYGADAKPTPTGVYPITQKDADHVSNLYNAPMPYMLRLTNDGISIHASDVRDGYMTHGCIGVPKAFAKKLFETVKLGDRVIVTRGERLDLGATIAAL